MFVKKDTRKIPDILADDNDEREELHLGRRCENSSLVFKFEIAERGLDHASVLAAGHQPGFE